MPELPEVQTTVNGLNEHVVGLTIDSVWTDFDSPYWYGRENIKDPKYFKKFKKLVSRAKIIKAERRGKNVLITLDNEYTILVHMKMTGHFLYGNFEYSKKLKEWLPIHDEKTVTDLGVAKIGHWDKSWPLSKEDVRKKLPLADPYNKFIHLVFHLSNGKRLCLSDMRKFATIKILNKDTLAKELKNIGPEPLSPEFGFAEFWARLKLRPEGKIKTVLMEPKVVAGIGNIYSDEALFLSQIHPESITSKIPPEKLRTLLPNIKKVLRKSLTKGGDSMGDYRKIDGRPGGFQNLHKVYQKENTVCPNCDLYSIQRIMVGQRSSRMCPRCQKLYR